MIIGASALSQFFQGLLCVAVGVMSALLWLVFEKIPLPKFLRVPTDALLVLATTIGLIASVQALNKGEILFFHPLTLLFGFFVTFRFLPKFFPKLQPSDAPREPKKRIKKKNHIYQSR